MKIEEFEFLPRGKTYKSLSPGVNLFVGKGASRAVEAVALLTTMGKRVCGVHGPLAVCAKIVSSGESRTLAVSLKDGFKEGILDLDKNEEHSLKSFLGRGAGEANSFYNEKRTCFDTALSDSDCSLLNFEEFMDLAEKDKTDFRPICILNFFERLDESIDLVPLLDRIAKLGRQVMLSVPNDKERCITALQEIGAHYKVFSCK